MLLNIWYCNKTILSMFSLYVNYFDCSILLSSFQSTSSSHQIDAFANSMSLLFISCFCYRALAHGYSSHHRIATMLLSRCWSGSMCCMPMVPMCTLFPPASSWPHPWFESITFASGPLLLCHDIMRRYSRCIEFKSWHIIEHSMHYYVTLPESYIHTNISWCQCYCYIFSF